MLRFQHTEYLWAFVVMPLLVLLFAYVLYWRQRQLKKIGDEALVRKQLLGHIPGRRTLRFVLLCVALGAMILGWANLQSGGKTDKTERKGVDVMIALDLSKSMLARDIQPDRLTRARQLISLMLDKMKNDRVGLIVFAGHAYLQVPLTTDYNSVKMLLQSASPEMIPTQGTVFSEAIQLAVKSFSSKEKKYKSLIIISDGEDHDANALAAVKDAVDQGVVIHTVGIGSAQGAHIIDPATGNEKLDEQGNPVISKLNEAELQSIAANGRGTYSLLANTDRVADKLVNEVDGMEQRKLGVVEYIAYNNYFQYFLAFAFALLILEWVLPAASRKVKPQSL